MRRLLTAREQVEMLSPWHTAMPWYHVSPHPFEEGDEVIPKGGPSPFVNFYKDYNVPQTDHVWLEQDKARADHWADQMEGYPNVYEVEPHNAPGAVPGGNTEYGGYTTDKATVTKSPWGRHPVNNP